jgi:hypothetical protein
VFAAGFQGRTAMLALDSGQLWWSHDMSSYRGLAVDADNLYVTESDGVIVAMRQRDGSELWRNDKLKRRALTAPTVTTSAVVIADYHGYLHWLDKKTGMLVSRQVVNKKQRVSNPIAVDGDTVVVLTDGGTLAAYRASPRAGNAPPAPVPAPAPATPPTESTAPPAESPAPAESPPQGETAQPAPPPAETAPPAPSPPPSSP